MCVARRRLGTYHRFSCNLIKNGLNWHHDFVVGIKDLTKTKPGITFVIHLGKDPADIVYVDFAHNPTKRFICRPGTAYVFPGYAIRHRTQREYTIESGAGVELPKRYSIGIWFPFKARSARAMDELIHNTWPACDDNYEDREY